MKKLFILLAVFFINLFISHAQWSPTSPTVVSNASGTQEDATMISDGMGGYIMAWVDYESTRLDIYIQRLNADGVPQWAANGLLVCDAVSYQYTPLLALCKTSANQTRVMVVWRDARTTPTKMFAQAYDLNGNAQWAINGVQVADNVAPLAHDVIPASDGQRVLFTWMKKGFSIFGSIYVQAINPDNGSTLYGGDGTLIDSDISPGDVKLGQAEGSTDINLAWSKNDDYNIYAQRINPATGGKQWVNSTPVCTAAETQSEIQIQGDIVVWRDNRFSNPNSEIFAQRLNANGTVAWTANGINVSNDPALQRQPRIASAGVNSVWVTWLDDVLNSKDSSFVSLQKINADGTLAFGSKGLRLTSSFEGSSQGMVVSQENGGALVLFESTGTSYARFRAHKISATGEKMWGPLGQPVSGLTTHGESPISIEGVPLAGGGAVFAEGNGNIWALRAKICDTPPAPPGITSPYRRCTPGTYSINLQSSGCPLGSVRYFTASDGLRLLTATNSPNTQIGLTGRDTTQYVYAECIINGCASTALMTPAHIQIAETSYTNAQLLATYPKTATDLPTVVLSQTTITAQSLVNSPANVLYESTQAVNLNPGFQADTGALFRAEVKTCVNLN